MVGLGYPDDEPTLDASEPPHQVVVYMESMASTLDSTAAGAVTGTTAPGTAGSNKTSAEAMADLRAAMTTLLETPVTVENQAERNTELAKLREQMAKVREDINAQNLCMAEVQAHIRSEAISSKQRPCT